MRTILMATLVLAPVLVHAQSQSSVQPRGANAPVLESRLVAPNAVESAPSANTTAVTSNLIQPKLIKWANITLPGRNWNSTRIVERVVTVSLTVTEDGVPTNLKIVDSADPQLNRSVLEAVANYRFSPASLDSKPTAIPMVLKVRVVPPSK
jgi:TonB family protein